MCPAVPKIFKIHVSNKRTKSKNRVAKKKEKNITYYSGSSSKMVNDHDVVLTRLRVLVLDFWLASSLSR